MKNKNIRMTALLASICLFSTLAFAASLGSNPKGKPFIEIAGQIVEVQNDIDTLEAAHQDLVDAVAALDLDLQGQINAINAEIAALQAKDVDLQASLNTVIAALDAQGSTINTLLQDLSNVNTDIVTLSNSVGDNELAIANLEAQQGAILADIAALDANIVTAITGIGDNLLLIEMLEFDIADLEANKQNDIDGTCPVGTSVTTVRDDGSLACAVTNSAGIVISQRIFGPFLDMDNFTIVTFHCHPVIGFFCIPEVHQNLQRISKESFLNCPSGFTVTGGGYSLNGNANLLVTASFPFDADTWFVSFVNTNNGNTFGFNARGRAQCVRVQ